jgi:hypothetical protein
METIRSTLHPAWRSALDVQGDVTRLVGVNAKSDAVPGAFRPECILSI